MESQPDLPFVLEVDPVVKARDPSLAEVRQVDLHDRIGRWTLMAVIKQGLAGPAAVFEDLESRTGPIIFMTQTGPLLELPKTLEPTRVPEAGCYRGHAKAAVVDSDRDILREELLAQGRDPTFEEIAACFPPIRR